MIRTLYSLFMRAAQPLLVRKLRRRSRAEPGYAVAVPERFGHYQSPAQPGALWIHAVSLGETRAAALLVQALRRHDPGLRLLLTHGTATGRAEGAQLLRPGDAQAWLPWDTPAAVGRFLDHFAPCAGVLMETEVWPQLAAACAQRGLPLMLANARLSPKSLAQTLRLRLLARPAFASLAAVWAQTESDAQRLTQVGARVSAVLGNLKFDAQPDAAKLAQGRLWRAQGATPVVLLASSREGEEAAFFRALAAYRSSGVRWLVVPRHPQRFDAVAQLAAQTGLTCVRRSTWGPAGPSAPGESPADVWIGDSVGEMALYYGLADVALLGGSFEPLGGHNLIEAAACACPLIMGPHTFNFDEAAQAAQKAGAALQGTDLDQGLKRALDLVAEPVRQAQMAAAGQAFAQAHRGATERTAQALLAQLAKP